ncbi:hypothetical protein [Povalibacter sp.]|uniref:hypothetical protein n=1 Tax=Povalibacter sp. TaxID=1962978 RepID=UPI0032C22700
MWSSRAERCLTSVIRAGFAESGALTSPPGSTSDPRCESGRWIEIPIRPVDAEQYPVGTLFRVLPNHACAMAAQHSAYQVVRGRGVEVVDTWPRINGW